MGGQFNYWGLWLDSEYGKGECSESCTTFKNYVQLGVNKNFTIRNIEVWAVGEKPVKDTVIYFRKVSPLTCEKERCCPLRLKLFYVTTDVAIDQLNLIFFLLVSGRITRTFGSRW